MCIRKKKLSYHKFGAQIPTLPGKDRLKLTEQQQRSRIYRPCSRLSSMDLQSSLSTDENVYTSITSLPADEYETPL